MTEQLLTLVPTYEALASTSKVHLIQSIVSRIFVNSIFEQYFVGLPKEQADDLKRVENNLSSIGELYTLCNSINLTDAGLSGKHKPMEVYYPLSAPKSRGAEAKGRDRRCCRSSYHPGEWDTIFNYRYAEL